MLPLAYTLLVSLLMGSSSAKSSDNISKVIFGFNFRYSGALYVEIWIITKGNNQGTFSDFAIWDIFVYFYSTYTSSSVITRVTVQFTCDLGPDLVICKNSVAHHHTRH